MQCVAMQKNNLGKLPCICNTMLQIHTLHLIYRGQMSKWEQTCKTGKNAKRVRSTHVKNLQPPKLIFGHRSHFPQPSSSSPHSSNFNNTQFLPVLFFPFVLPLDHQNFLFLSPTRDTYYTLHISLLYLYISSNKKLQISGFLN